jgi:predicted transcriptional regulator
MSFSKIDDGTNLPVAESEKVKAAFVTEALTSWQHYKETGLHLTGDEIQAWLSTWGTDEETNPPPNHT